MILPSSYAVTLILAIVSMLCWGLWANTLKFSGKWRFELYYFDFAIGFSVASLVVALTFGTLGFDGFSFLDDFLHAGKKQDLYAFMAGVVFNLGNMLLVGAIAESGIAVAMPIGLGVALATASIWNFLLNPGSNAPLLFAGVAIVLLAVILVATAYRMFKFSKIDEMVRTGQLKSTRKRVSLKGVIVAAIGGLFAGSYLPLIGKATETDAGLGPYSIGVLFAVGLIFSTFLYNLILMNLPISGEPVEIFEYFKGTLSQHLLGLAGGAMWLTALVAALVAVFGATGPESPTGVSQALINGLGQGSIPIAALCGFFYWGEFEGADSRVRALFFLSLALFICGIGLVSVAPAWTRG